ncbi:FtsH protease activity modulator HflK [Salinibius halmophilus]|uniref:FtsH protease activity modulator HflK n=1 Tax=Salinibius halmophilus TaxID=1853216 RepID=UPI000E66ACDF|nr:FtsH protease activity modulator HflK [Salinibius halmophilus]
MAWNEPPGNDQDPWGKKRPNQDGPPDLDEVFNNLSKQFGKLLGGKGGSGNRNSNNNGGDGGFSALTLWGVLGVALVIFIGWNSVYTVGEQERGVVLRLGKFQTVQQPGLKFKAPIIDTVEIVNVTQLREYSYRSTMLTKDENIVDVRMSIQYNVEDPKAFALNVRSPSMSLEQSAESALRHEVGSRNLEEVLVSGRVGLAEEVDKRLRSFMETYGTGVQISAVNIEETSAPRQVVDAFADVVKAREDQQRFINEAESYRNQIVPVARGEKQRMIEEAQGYFASKTETALGEAERFEALLAEYQQSPDVTRQRLYIETVSDVYSRSGKVLMGADGEGSDNVLYLPLDRLNNRSNSGQ